MQLNNALDQKDLTDIYRKFHPKEAKYTFFSNAHEIFSKIDHIIRHTHTKKNPQQIQENWNRMKHFFRPEGLETRNQPQGQNWKISKHMETE